MALNDSVQDNFDVRLTVTDVPDSVTFINQPPSEIHVTVRDKGTSLMRHGWLNKSHVNFNFKEFAQGGVMRLSRTDILAGLKAVFGSNAIVSSVSVDSLRLVYTTSPGKRVPVLVEADVTASSGNIVSGRFIPQPSAVLIYSADPDVPDTITRVRTQKIIRRDLSETTVAEVRLVGIPGVRMIPDNIRVSIPVEPLVSKESMVGIEAVNVPAGQNLVLFPAKVSVSYYLPMSRFGDTDPGLKLTVDYNDIKRIFSDRLPVRLERVPAGIANVVVRTDSVEYTLIKD